MRTPPELTGPRAATALPLTIASLLAACACGPAEVGGPGIYDTDAWEPDHNITPDDQPCVAPACDSGDLSACCAGVQPAGGGADDTGGGAALPEDCPGNAYPNNWTCVSGQCVHGGCSTDADCGHPMLKCLDPTELSGTTKYCLQTCDTSPFDTCNWVNTATKCTGLASTQQSYCRQDPQPD